MKSKKAGRIAATWYAMAVVLALGSLIAVPPHLEGLAQVSIPEEIEWTWEVRPAASDPGLPNVLLLGDSITRNYYPAVARRLAGKANVFLLATSTSVGDPRLGPEIMQFSSMEAVHFSVVHFNNGMHGWAYTEPQYRAAFPGLFQTLRSMWPRAKLIWATTTPVRPDAKTGATNPRIDERNAIALSLIHGSDIAIDDEHALMLKHADLYQDAVHFNEEGAEIQASQVAAGIQAALSGTPR